MPPNATNEPPVGGTKLVVIALALAVAAVIAVNVYVEMIRKQVEQSSFKVYKVTRSIRPGDRLKDRDVQEVNVPTSFQQAFTELGAVSETDMKTRLSENRPLERPINQGEILLFSHFNPPEGQYNDLQITQGKRLVSLPVNSRTVPGNLRPGMYVDIEAPFSSGGPMPVTMPVLERVKIMAVGTRTLTDESGGDRPRSGGSYNSISFEVDPYQAADLSMIERIAMGEFEIYIRNPQDTSTPKIRTGGINPDVLDLLESRRSSLLSAGKQAVSLPINTRSIPGNLRPGMYVDVTGSFKQSGSAETLTVIERCRVIAVGKQTLDTSGAKGSSTANFQNITIEVSPEDAVSLSRVKNAVTGDFDVRVRNNNDPVMIPNGGVNPQLLELINRGGGSRKN